MMKKVWRHLTVFLCWGIIFFLGSTSAVSAQEPAAEFTLDEIIVTAERRETSIQDTPLSVSALTKDLLDEENVEGLTDLTMRMPGATFAADNINIRGIGREMADLGSDVGVGVFFDGAYNEQFAELGTLVDVERLETVRGPQSTLYGRNTIGGAINIIYARPKDEFSGQVKASIGNYEAREFTAILNSPIIGDWLLGRISYFDRYYGGHVKNLVHNEYIGNDDDWQLNMKLLFSPTSNFNSYFQYKITNIRGTNEERESDILPYDDDGPLSKSTVGTQYKPSTPNALYGLKNPNTGGQNPYVSIANHIGVPILDAYEVSLATDLDIGNLTFKHLMFYRWWENYYHFDYDGGSSLIDDRVFYQYYDVHEWSQEFQVFYGGPDSRFTALAGIYYFSNTKTYQTKYAYGGELNWEYAYDDPAVGWTAMAGNQAYGYNVELESNSKSAYLNMDYQLTDTLTLTLGGRYAIDDKWTQENGKLAYWIPSQTAFGVRNENYRQIMGITEDLDSLDGLDPDSAEYIYAAHMLGYYYAGRPYWLSMGKNAEIKKDWDAIMWKIGVDYRPADNRLYYFSVNRGYKPGGVSISNVSGTVNSFDPEYLMSYEIGGKAQWLNDRLQSVLSIYYYDFQDKQLAYSVLPEGASRTESFTTNAADTENYGFELEGSFLVTQNLLASLQYSYLHAEYVTDFIVYNDATGQNENLKGTELPYSPPHKITLRGRYTIPTDIGEFVLIGTYNWQDEVLGNLWDYEYNRAKPWDIVNAQVMWLSPDYAWRITLWGKNIFDHASVVRQNGYLDSDADAPMGSISRKTQSVVDPFQFGVDISYKW